MIEGLQAVVEAAQGGGVSKESRLGVWGSREKGRTAGAGRARRKELQGCLQGKMQPEWSRAPNTQRVSWERGGQSRVEAGLVAVRKALGL